MALQVGLADFQFVHPTEMENYTTVTLLQDFSTDDKGIVHQKKETLTRQRRKRVALPGAKVLVKSINMFGKQAEMTFLFDESGRALCAVQQTDLPQLPTDVDYEVRFPNGMAEHGKVRVGGNEQIRVTEVVLRVA